MAVRKRLTHDMRTREKIRTTQIIHRLTRHILAEPSSKTYKKNLMTSAQVRAAEVLLRKTLPDLHTIDGTIDHNITGEVDHKHKHQEVKQEKAFDFYEWKNRKAANE